MQFSGSDARNQQLQEGHVYNFNLTMHRNPKQGRGSRAQAQHAPRVALGLPVWTLVLQSSLGFVNVEV